MPMSADPAPAQNEQTQTIPMDTPRQSSLDMHAQSDHQCPLHAQFIENMVHRSTRGPQSTPVIERPYSPTFMTISYRYRRCDCSPCLLESRDEATRSPISCSHLETRPYALTSRIHETVEIHCSPRHRALEAYIACICTICARGDITLRGGWSLSQFPGSMARTKSHEVGFSYNVSACVSPSSLYRVCCSSCRYRCI